jgi:glycosyltransferase involved in cell wall biosynthesis
MEEDGVDHVHCHFANHPAVAGFLVHRLTGIPYSFTAHGSDLHVDRHMLCRKVAEAAFVVTISEYNRRLILHECGERFGDKVTVIHSGVDTSLFDGSDRPSSSDTFTILSVGTLHEVKGQTVLVDACRRLADSGVNAVCRLVGSGPDRDRLERQIASSGLTGRVILEGSRTRDEVAALLREADVLAAPSVPTKAGKREGIPVVLMEAQASALPVVASDLSGIPELVEDGVTGLLVPPGDPGALARALERLAGDPELRRRLGAAGRQKVVREFELRRTAAALVDLFRTEAVAAR